jgi:LAO/AO transport system kinase
MQTLADGVLHGDRKSVARALSLAERGATRALELLDRIQPQTGRAHVIGVTGAPGSGKSTLVGAMAESYRKGGLSVGVLAIDPSSSFTGGSLLGDRIRMARPALDPGVFIRSMASRAELGGLAPSTFAAVQILDAAGYERILIETVGAGQAEVDVVQVADTTLVLLVPGLGDEVQMFKAGIMEIADIFVLNKADRDGVERLEAGVEAMLDLVPPVGWRPPIVRTVASRGDGIESLASHAANHLEWLRKHGESRVRARIELLLRKSLQALLTQSVLDALTRDDRLDAIVDRIAKGELTPIRAAQEIATDALKARP